MKYIKVNNELFVFDISKKSGGSYAPYYLFKQKPTYQYITGMFCVDKKKQIYQGKSIDGRKYIYHLQNNNLIIR